MLRRNIGFWLTVLTLLLGSMPVRAESDAGMLEKFNRAMHDFNEKYYVSSGSGPNQFLADTIPEEFRHGMANFFVNMGEPVVAISSLAQGDVDNAEIAARRFVYNLVYGYGGVLDRATEAGVVSVPRDLGQAICSVGMPDGPFLVLPFYGPSTVTDLFGSALPILAGYVALGEVFWVYRASSRVAAYIDDKDAENKAGAGAAATGDAAAQAETAEAARAEAARLEQAYQLEKERYLAAREAACHRQQQENAPAPADHALDADAKLTAELASAPLPEESRPGPTSTSQ